MRTMILPILFILKVAIILGIWWFISFIIKQADKQAKQWVKETLKEAKEEEQQ